MATGSRVVYEFGPFRIDPETQILLRENQPVAITPKTFETLLVLVRHSREVVSKDDLMKQLWPDSFVEEANLSQNIFMLRKVLGDTPEDRHYIATVPGKGYRFIAEVRTVTQDGVNVVIASSSRSQVVVEEQESPAREGLLAVPAKAGRRFRREHIAGITAAAALLLIGIIWFLHRRQPVPLGAKDSVLIADFTNTTGETVFDETLRHGLAIQLRQSPFLSLVSDDRIQQTLGLMGKPTDTKLFPQLAREVCVRTGSAAVLEGSIASLGSEYVLGLRATNCHTGDVVAEEQAQAGKKEEVLKALSVIAGQLRVRMGESMATVEQHNLPLENATTSSLEALKAYSTGMQVTMAKGSVDAIPHFQRAIELDPQFAIAYAQLGLLYANLGESALAVENTAKAYDLRDRTSDREKFLIMTLYYRNVTGNLEKELQTLQSWAQTYPRDLDAHGLQSGFASQGLGQQERSIAEATVALEIDPDFTPGFRQYRLCLPISRSSGGRGESARTSRAAQTRVA